MPNIKSAKKRVCVIEKKNLENRMCRSQITTAIKKINAAIEDNDMELVDKLFPEVVAIIDKAVAKGIIHRNNAAHKKSTVQTRINDVKSGKLVITKKLDNKTIAAQKAKAAKEAREAVRAEAKAKADAKAAEKAALDPKATKKKTTTKAKAEKPAKEEKVKAEKPAKEESVAKEEKPKATAKPKAEKATPKAKKTTTKTEETKSE
ncbi:MAG: 30S ribosomal protein S20 [Firmicutes bacterium]|nr:30S ribosomal protein S20 [Bacillota bacterium]